MSFRAGARIPRAPFLFAEGFVDGSWAGDTVRGPEPGTGRSGALSTVIHAYAERSLRISVPPSYVLFDLS